MSFKAPRISVKKWNEIENDSIGSYEYWGAKYIDRKSDYISGGVMITFDDTKYPDYIEYYEEQYEQNDDFINFIDDIFNDCAIGDNIEKENLVIENDKGKISFYFEYQADIPENDCDY